ncbi:MAG: hypothetical protein ORN21_06685 [Methylophilaceae bacterium]|nr:hypothetical protein [Methylophilaceae bacterium]
MKHQASSKCLKPMVRVFKNMRSNMVEKRLIAANLAPSYYIESLLYNVPDNKFTTNYQHCVYNILNWYQKKAQNSNLECGNRQFYLLRNGCWQQEDCDDFIKATVTL